MYRYVWCFPTFPKDGTLSARESAMKRARFYLPSGLLPVLSTAQCLLVIVRQLSEKVEVVNKSHQAFTNVDAKYGEIPK